MLVKVSMLVLVLTFQLSFRSVLGDLLEDGVYWDVVYGPNPVIIDGTIEEKEWNDSTVTMTSTARLLRIYSKENTEKVLLAFDCPDPSIVQIAFDVDNSGETTPQPGDIMLQLGQNSTEYEGDGIGWRAVQKGSDWTANIGISRVYELEIDYSKLTLEPGVGKKIGLFIDIKGVTGHTTFPDKGSIYSPSSWLDMGSSDNWSTRQPLYLPPILQNGRVSPTKGFTDTEFVYSITYIDDVTGNAPIQSDVIIDGVPYEMTSQDENFTDGAVFELKKSLPDGQHRYHFIFSDGRTDLRFPGMGDINGPFVSEPNQAPVLMGSGIPTDTFSIPEDSPPVEDLIDLEQYFTDDRDDGRLSFTIFGGGDLDQIELSINGRNLSVKVLVPDWFGSVEVTVMAIDNGIEGYSLEETRLETLSNPFTITVLSINDPPNEPVVDTGGIDPEGGLEFKKGQKVELRASAIDRDSLFDPLESITISWSSDRDGYLHRGPTLNIESLSIGHHILNVSATDSSGASSFSLIEVNIIDGSSTWYSDLRDDFYLALVPIIIVWTLVFLLAFFVYTRLKSKSLLDNVNRKLIFEAIREDPGINFTMLSKKLGLKQGVLSHHLNILEKNQFIRSLQDGIYRRFYLFDQKIEFKITLTEVQHTILYLISQNPGLNQSRISAVLGRNKMVVNYHIRILKDIGLLSLDRDGRETHCFLTSNAKDLLASGGSA